MLIQAGLSIHIPPRAELWDPGCTVAREALAWPTLHRVARDQVAARAEDRSLDRRLSTICCPTRRDSQRRGLLPAEDPAQHMPMPFLLGSLL